MHDQASSVILNTSQFHQNNSVGILEADFNSPNKRPAHLKSSYLSRRITQQIPQINQQTPGSKSSYLQPALSDYNSIHNQPQFGGQRVILKKVGKNQSNSKKELQQYEDEMNDSLSKHELVMNRNYILTKTEDENSPISQQKGSSQDIILEAKGMSSRQGPSAGSQSKLSFFQNYMNPSLYQNSMDQSTPLQLAPIATAIARPNDNMKAQGQILYQNTPSQQTNSAQYHLRIPNVQGDNASRLVHHSIVSFGQTADHFKAAENNNSLYLGNQPTAIKPNTSNNLIKQRRRTLHAPLQRYHRGTAIRQNQDISSQLLVVQAHDNMNRSVTNIDELLNAPQTIKQGVIQIKDQTALKDSTEENSTNNFKDYVGSGPQVQHKVNRQLRQQQQAPIAKSQITREQSHTEDTGIATKSGEGGGRGSDPITKGKGSLAGVIDIEISSQIKSQGDNSYQIGSASVPNRESAEDNKSSETMFSGRNVQENYSNILRPRGIEMFQSQGYEISTSGQPSPFNEVRMTNLNELKGKDVILLAAQQQQQQPPGTSLPGRRQSKRFPNKDFHFSAERYGERVLDLELDSEELDEFEDNIRSPVRNIQQYHVDIGIIQPQVEVRLSHNSSISKQEKQDMSFQRTQTKTEMRMTNSKENPDVEKSLNHSPSKLKLGLQEENLRRSQRNSLGKSQKKLSDQIKIQNNNSHLQESDQYTESPNRSLIQKQQTGAVSERSKKIVYQKGVSSGVMPSQNISRLEQISTIVDPKIKELTYEIEEIVRDIGTNIIEDESFFGNEVLHDDFNLENIDELSGLFGDMSIDGQENPQAQTGFQDKHLLEQLPTLTEVRQLHSRLMNKPATGHTHHRVAIDRKGPPKKLFDYLPKGRRLILRDPRVAGKFSVLIPIPPNPDLSVQNSSLPLFHVRNIQLNPQNQQLIKGLEMKGISINQLPLALKECFDYYFNSKHHDHETQQKIFNNYHQIPHSSSQEVRIPQMVSENQFQKQSLIENLHLIQEDGDNIPSNNNTNQDQRQDVEKKVSSFAAQNLGGGYGSRINLLSTNQQLKKTPESQGIQQQDQNLRELFQTSTEDEKSQIQYPPRDTLESAMNTQNLKDLSNISNLTSYEFESKILKNNYKEYLGATGLIQGTQQNLNEDLKAINKVMSTIPQKKPTANKTENITPKEYKIKVHQANAQYEHRLRPITQMMFNQDSGVLNTHIEKIQNFQNNIRTNIPMSLPIVGFGTFSNANIDESAKNYIEGNNINRLESHPSQRVLQKQELAYRTASRSTLHGQQNQGDYTNIGQGHITQRKDDSHRHSLDLSTYSKGNEYLTFYQGVETNQKMLRPIADIFVHNKNNEPKTGGDHQQLQGRKTAAPSTRGKIQDTRYAQNKYHIKRAQRPTKSPTVQQQASSSIKKSPTKQNLGSIEQDVDQESQASPYKRKPGGLLSEISRQFSEAINRKNRTKMGFFMNQRMNSSQGYIEKQKSGDRTIQNQNLPNKLKLSMKDTNSQNGRSNLGSQKGPRYTLTSDDHSPTVATGVKNTLMGQQMIKTQSGIGQISVQFNQGTPINLHNTDSLRPKSTSIIGVGALGSHLSASQNQVYQKYLKFAQAGKLQLLGKLNRKAAEVRVGLKSVAQQQQFQFPDNFILSPNVTYPEQRISGNQSAILPVRQREFQMDQYGMGTP